MAITRKRSGRLVERVLAVVVILLVLLSLCVDGLFIYYKFLNKDITIGVNYLGDQTAIDVKAISAEQQADYEKRCILEANYYSNDRGNGIELNELMVNYFTDWTLTSDKYRSTGIISNTAIIKLKILCFVLIFPPLYNYNSSIYICVYI